MSVPVSQTDTVENDSEEEGVDFVVERPQDPLLEDDPAEVRKAYKIITECDALRKVRGGVQPRVAVCGCVRRCSVQAQLRRSQHREWTPEGRIRVDGIKFWVAMRSIRDQNLQLGGGRRDAYGSRTVTDGCFPAATDPCLRAQALRFSLAPFLRRVHEHLCAREQSSVHAMARMFGGGKTQSRKTPLKLCAAIMCRLHGVCSVLLTTGTSGRDDLFNKFFELLATVDDDLSQASQASQSSQSPSFGYVHTGSGLELQKLQSSDSAARVLRINDITNSDGKRRWALSELGRGACLIVNNTAAAISKARSLITEVRADSKLTTGRMKS
eukprot:3351036-Pleurochrysis_carterae.AAC.1